MNSTFNPDEISVNEEEDDDNDDDESEDGEG